MYPGYRPALYPGYRLNKQSNVIREAPGDEHEPPERVEEEAGVLHCLCTALIFGDVEGGAELVAQVHPPLVKRFGLGQG